VAGSHRPPQSVTNNAINLVALLTSLATLWWLLGHGAHIDPLAAVLLLGGAYALPIMALEAIWLQREPTPPGPGGEDTDYRRVPVKLLGLLLTLGLFAALYWMLPEYRGSFYDRYYEALRGVIPWGVLLAVPYFFWMEKRGSGRDAYWQMGRLALLRPHDTVPSEIAQHLLAWGVKFFFLPLMFTYMADKVVFFREFDFGTVFDSFKDFFDFVYGSLFYIDLLVACAGYACTFRIADTHIRSTEPTFLGWFVALMCYQPFWSFFSAQYLEYHPGRGWGYWFTDTPQLYMLWGSAILVLVAIFAWATLSFGLRFSNLTHRGIITNGPYRWCKHPAYVAKNLSYWLIAMPFMFHSSGWESLRLCLLLILLNIVYLMRARTEERHLSRDPAYCEYALYIEEHGLFSAVGRKFPLLRFCPGHLFNRPAAAAVQQPGGKSSGSRGS